MRSVALGLLVAGAGCTQILGLEPPILIDASPDGLNDVAKIPVSLTYIAPVLDPQFVPQAPAFRPIDPAPHVRYGRLGAPLLDVTYEADGSLTLPADMGTGWRLVYTLAGEPPREVQFSSPAVPRLVVPYLGGVDREPLPGSAAVYQLGPSMPPATFSNVRVFTTGAWSEREYATASSPLLHDPRDGVTVREPLRTPDPAKGDRIALFEYGPSADSSDNCFDARRAAIFDIELSNAPSADPTPPAWPSTFTTNGSIAFEGLGQGDSQGAESLTKERVRTATGASPGTVSSHYLGGFTTGLAIPQEIFVRSGKFGPSLPNADLPLAAPPMVVLAYCTRLTTQAGMAHVTFADDFTDTPRIAHVQYDAVQRTGGVPLRAGYTSTGLVSADHKISPILGLALSYANAALGSSDLRPNAFMEDDVRIDASASTLDLTFDLDGGSIEPHFYEVTLARLTGSEPEPLRIYTVTERKVTIETSELASGIRHVFSIRGVRGAPRAKDNDFSQWELPQAASLVWTRTFVR